MNSLPFDRQNNPASFHHQALVEGYGWPTVLAAPGCRVIAANQTWRASDPDSVAPMLCHDDPRQPRRRVCPPDCLLKQAARHQGAWLQKDSLWVFPVDSGQGIFLIVQRDPARWQYPEDLPGLAGSSAAIGRLRQLILKVADTDVGVLLLGEPGTGRRQVARAIHRAGQRRDRPFETLDSRAIAGLTAALQGPPQIPLPENGTLYIKDIAALPLPWQYALLQTLEAGANFRPIASAGADFERQVTQGEFNADLYYEIAVLPIHVPPLRERPEDIPLIVRHMLARRFTPEGTPILHPQLLLALMEHDFPGNLRELRSLLERVLLFAEGGVVTADALGISTAATNTELTPGTGQAPIIPLKDLELRYLQEITREHPGSKHELARQLGVSERTLYRKLQRLRSADPMVTGGQQG